MIDREKFPGVPFLLKNAFTKKHWDEMWREDPDGMTVAIGMPLTVVFIIAGAVALISLNSCLRNREVQDLSGENISYSQEVKPTSYAISLREESK